MHSERDALRTILTTASEHEAGQAGPVAVDLDWSIPHRFDPAQAGRLGGFQSAIAKRMSAALGALVGSALPMTPLAASEHYLGELSAGIAGSYCVPLTDESEQKCGFVHIPAASAAAWVGRLLGKSSVPDGAARDLSSLEMVLLLDVVSAALGGAYPAFEEHHLRPLHRAEHVLKGETGLGGADADEFVYLGFQCDQAVGGMQINLYLGAELLGAAVAVGGSVTSLPQDQTRKLLLEHVEGLFLAGEVVVGSSAVAMGDIMSLQPGDVLVMDKRADEPMDFVLAGQTLLQGHLVTCQGRYALEITSKAQVERQ
jgi:flagellar motor switch/type III secretory pathway protein FliN